MNKISSLKIENENLKEENLKLTNRLNKITVNSKRESLKLNKMITDSIGHQLQMEKEESVIRCEELVLEVDKLKAVLALKEKKVASLQKSIKESQLFNHHEKEVIKSENTSLITKLNDLQRK